MAIPKPSSRFPKSSLAETAKETLSTAPGSQRPITRVGPGPGLGPWTRPLAELRVTLGLQVSARAQASVGILLTLGPKQVHQASPLFSPLFSPLGASSCSPQPCR